MINPVLGALFVFVFISSHEEFAGKHSFASHTKQAAEINGSTSFM